MPEGGFDMTKAAGGIISIDDMDADTGWINDGVVFSTPSWEDYQPAIANNHFEYRRIGKVVHLRGLARRVTAYSSTNPSTILTLPSGLRPSRSLIFGALTSATMTTSATTAGGTSHTHTVGDSANLGPMNRVTIDSAGAVAFQQGSGSSMGANSWVSLSNISFMID